MTSVFINSGYQLSRSIVLLNYIPLNWLFGISLVFYWEIIYLFLSCLFCFSFFFISLTFESLLIYSDSIGDFWLISWFQFSEFCFVYDYGFYKIISRDSSAYKFISWFLDIYFLDWEELEINWWSIKFVILLMP